MDKILCDELIQEIFHRLPPPSSAAVSLVSKRFLHLRRISTTSLSLKSPLSTFLTNHPYLTSLSISATSPISSLNSLSISHPNLSSLSLTLSRPLSLSWLIPFKKLKSLSLNIITNSSPDHQTVTSEVKVNADEAELGLETLSLSGLLPGDYEISFLWRNCTRVNKLELKSCESLGDYNSFSCFVKALTFLKEVNLRKCRSVVDSVLSKLGECCVSLESLLVHDGGSREGLLRFVNRSESDLRKLDFRLPLDLDNTCLVAVSESMRFRGLVSLRLQSCCLVTGEGLRAVCRALGDGIEELALVNCDVVERECGLLTSLGQSLRGLRKLDLSYNDLLVDKEVMAMLVSCGLLRELKLRGCGKLSDVVLGSIVRSCKGLGSVDLTCCRGVNSYFLLTTTNENVIHKGISHKESRASATILIIYTNDLVRYVTLI